jgi:Integrase zinc binding domain
MNPADDATRSSVKQFNTDSQWFKGPVFLQVSIDEWLQESKTDNDGECDNIQGLYIRHDEEQNILALQEEEFFNEIEQKSSSWPKMVRVLAWVKRFIFNCRSSIRKKGELDIDEIKSSEKSWWQHVQRQHFSEDIARMKKGETIKMRYLNELNAFIDDDGVIRAGGRVRKSSFVLEETKHPVIMNGNSPVVEKLVHSYHVKNMHQGRETVLNELKQKFHMTKMRAVVKKVFYCCRFCRRVKAVPRPAKMADLPECRLMPNLPPFSFTGMDYFGPIAVTIGRRHEKRWGVIFTCMASRATHIELAHSLSTDSAIMAINRFRARRGAVLEMFSDNGTNLKGAAVELKKAVQELKVDKIQQTFAMKEMKWFFNPPAAPHVGGCWERLIKPVKSAMMNILTRMILRVLRRIIFFLERGSSC